MMHWPGRGSVPPDGPEELLREVPVVRAAREPKVPLRGRPPERKWRPVMVQLHLVPRPASRTIVHHHCTAAAIPFPDSPDHLFRHVAAATIENVGRNRWIDEVVPAARH